MRTCAFVTYNTVGEGLSSGWHEGLAGRRAFVLQNTRGEHQAATSDPFSDFLTSTFGSESDRRAVRSRRLSRRGEEIDKLWGQLQEVLSDLDHFVVYVGAAGSERAISLAGALPEQKITFVACDCSLPFKERLIRDAGLINAGRVLSECGGHETMRKLYDNFLQGGELLPQSQIAQY